MEQNNHNPYSVFPTLEHMASVNLILPYWNQPEIVNELKQISCYDTPTWCHVVSKILSKLIIKILNTMDDLLEKLPNSLIMRLIDVNILVGCELCGWLMNVLCDVSSFFKKVKKIDFDNFMECIIWSPLGVIDHKLSAKALCAKPELTDVHKYTLACNYCLIDDVIHISSTTDLSWLFKCKKLEMFLYQNPMVGLLTNSLSDEVSTSNLFPQSNLIVQSNSTNEDAIKYIWNNLNEQQKLENFLHIFNCSYTSATKYYILSQMENAKIIDYKIHGEIILLSEIERAIFEGKFFRSFTHILPFVDENSYITLLKKLICVVNEEHDWGQSTIRDKNSQSLLFNKVTNELLKQVTCNLTSNGKLIQYLNYYEKYRLEKYTVVLNELLKCTPHHVRKQIFQPRQWVTNCFVTYLMLLLSINDDDYFNISFILSLFNYDEKFVFISNDIFRNKCADFIINRQSSLTDKLISLCFESDDERRNFKRVCFDYTVKNIVIKCVDYDIKRLDEFVDYFCGELPNGIIITNKSIILSSVETMKQLFKKCFLTSTLKLDSDKLNSIFMWLCNAKDVGELNSYKMDVFKDKIYNDCFVKIICELFRAGKKNPVNYMLINQIFFWLANSEETGNVNLIMLKNNFCSNNSSCILKLIIGLSWRSDKWKSLIEFIDWCFPLEISYDERKCKFLKEIVRDKNRLIYLISELIISQKFKEVGVILTWYCEEYELDLKKFKNELMLDDNMMHENMMRRILQSFYEFDCLGFIRLFDPTLQTLELFKKKFLQEFWFEIFLPVLKKLQIK